MKRFVALIFCLSGMVSAQEQQGGAASAQDLGSSWVDIRSGGVVGKEGGAPSIVLFLDNKTDQAIWVKVEVGSPDPAQNCTVTRPFPARGRLPFACPQKEIVPGQDYPVLVEVFSDEALTDRLESKSTKIHFRAEDVAALKKLLNVPRQTVTLTDIWFRTEESQLLIAYKEAGTLEVTGEKLTFVYAGGKLEIPVAAIQRLVPRRRFAIFDSNEWAVVEYQLSGKNLVAAFKPAAFTGKTPHEAIVKAIRNVLPR